jgi:hypothetical protein
MSPETQQSAIESINYLCESQVEYETTHRDAGDNYSHMPAENWTDHDTESLLESLKEEKQVDKRWQALDPDLLADMALDSFSMSAGSTYGCYKAGITLAGYPVQEIEIDLEHLGIDYITMDLIRESCDAYISGCDRAYVPTDAVWLALLDVQMLNAHIQQHFDDVESL